MKGKFEVKWLELEADYFKSHDHVWQIVDGLAVCVAEGCPSEEQGE